MFPLLKQQKAPSGRDLMHNSQFVEDPMQKLIMQAKATKSPELMQRLGFMQKDQERADAQNQMMETAEMQKAAADQNDPTKQLLNQMPVSPLLQRLPGFQQRAKLDISQGKMPSFLDTLFPKF